MKLILLQTGEKALLLTPVKSGKRPVFGAPRVFSLPETMQNGAVFADPPRFAAFVRHCAAAARLSGRHFVLSLDDDEIVSREYQHLPAKPRALAAFARLEADAVLPDGIEEYLLLNCEYGHRNENTGKLTGSLFAAKSDLITGLKKAFARAGMRLVRAAPAAAGFLTAVRSSLPTAGQTVAVLELGFEKFRLLVLHDGYPVFLRSFGGIYEDILTIIMREKTIPLRDAAALVQERGVSADGSLSEAAAGQIATLLDASAGELIRGLRMVLSSERLELNRMVFCGAMASLPGMDKFWEQLGLDIPLESIDRRAANATLPKIERGLPATVRAADFITASGTVSLRRAKQFNFLTALKYRRGLTPGNLATLAVITALSVCIMAIQPVLLAVKTNQAAQDSAALAGTKYDEVKSLLQQEQRLNAQKGTLQADRSTLPYGKSKTQQAAARLWDQIADKVQSVQTYTVDDSTGTVALSFQTANFSDYLAVRHAIESAGTFKIAVPFTVTAAEKGFTCSIQLKIVGFQSYRPSGENSKSKDGAAK